MFDVDPQFGVVPATIDAALTFGSSVTIEGRGTIGVNDYSNPFEFKRIINQGTVSANLNGSTLSLNALQFQNSGILQANHGGRLQVSGLVGDLNTVEVRHQGSSLRLDGNGYVVNHGLLANQADWFDLLGNWTNASGSEISVTNAKTVTLGSNDAVWSNAGTISLTNSPAVVLGTVTFAGLGTLNSVGTHPQFYGTLDNRGKTLSLDLLLDEVDLAGGKILGGIISSTDSLPINNTSLDLTLQDVVINTNLTVPSGSTLQLSGDWRNNAAITVNQGGRLDLGGMFSSTDWGTVTTVGTGTVAISGVYDNLDTTLLIDDSFSNWQLVGGTIRGGTIEFQDATRQMLTALGSGGVLDGVDIRGDILLGNNANLTIEGGTVFQTAHLRGAYSSLAFAPNQILTGTVLFEPQTDLSYNGSQSSYIQLLGPNPKLTIAPTGAIRTSDRFRGSAEIYFDGVIQEGTLLNQGTLAVTGGEGGTGYLSIYGVQVRNEGALQVGPRGYLNVNNLTGNLNQLELANGANGVYVSGEDYVINRDISVSEGTSLTLGGSWTNTATITVTGGELGLGDYPDDDFYELRRWHNTGTIQTTDTDFFVNGLFNLDDLEDLTHSGGSTTLGGVLDNSGATLVADSLFTNWQFQGATIRGGIISSASDLVLKEGDNLTLESVTLQSDLAVPAGSSLMLTGDWMNSGAITVEGNLILDGSVTTAQLGTIQNVSGTVLIQGTIDNANATLALNGQTGVWTLADGTIRGGTLDLGDGSKFVIRSNDYYYYYSDPVSSTLDGVVVQGELIVGGTAPGYYSYSPPRLLLTNGTTFGNVHLSGFGSTVLVGEGQTITGTILLEGDGDLNVGTQRSDHSLTISPTGAIRTAADFQGAAQIGSIYEYFYYYFDRIADSLVNEGTIQVNQPGAYVVLQARQISNDGTLRVGGGGRLDIQGLTGETGDIVVEGGGSLDLQGEDYVINQPLAVGAQSVLSLYGEWTNNSTISANDAELRLVGTHWENANTINVTNSAVRLEGDFTLGTFNRTGGTVAFAGTLDNTNSTIALDLLANDLQFEPGARIRGGTATVTSGEFTLPADQSLILDSVNLSGVIHLPASTSLELTGDWTNSATIAIDGGTLRLGGEFTASEIGVVQRNSGQVALTGTLDNRGETLTLDSSTGSWRLEGGTILGGVVNLLDSQTLVATSSWGLLDGVTVEGDIVLAEQYAWVSLTNGASFSTAHLAGNYTALGFRPGQVLSGNVLFEGTGTGDRRLIGSGTLTIAPTATLRTTVDFGGSATVGNSATWLNNSGRISSETPGKVITIAPRFLANGGILESSNGGVLSVSATRWRNQGVIRSTNGTLNLGGNVMKADVGTIERTVGSVNLTGRLDNLDSTIQLDATTGSWNLKGGQIVGGTYASNDGAALIFTSAGGTLDGVTANADLDLATNYGAYAHVVNGLTLNGTAWLGNATGSTYGGLYFDNTQTLGGTGTVLFGKSSSNFLNTYSTTNENANTLTIGPSITIRGSSGNMSNGYYYGYASTIVNQGTILADDSGGLSSFAYDTGFSDSYYVSTTNTAATIDTGDVTNPAPQIVYQTAREGYYYSSSFAYTLSDLTPDAIYTVRLHFAEIQQDVKVGERLFHVDLNGTRVLTDFDIRDTAGGVNKAVVEEFTATADASGQIVIDLIGVYTPAYYNGPSINGLELLSGGTVVQAINAGQQAGGTFSINRSSFVNQGTIVVSGGEALSISNLSGNTGNMSLIDPGSRLSLNGDYVVNQGLSADADQTLTLGGTWTNASGSTIKATGATLNVGSDGNTWSNAGTMTATDSTVNLGGVFTNSGLGTFHRSGGTVNLTGTIDNRHIDQELLSGASTAKVLVPTDDSLGNSWLAPTFDDSSWTSGPASVGFDRNSGRPYASQILTDVEASMFNHNNSVYIRVPFNVVDPTALSGMMLNMKYDDGFVAYLNGVEIPRSNGLYNTPTWNSSATYIHDANQLQSFDLSGAVNLLQPGTNVLAIQGLNYDNYYYKPLDPDLLLQPQLLVGLKSTDAALSLNSTTGSWNLLGGRIQGGAYTSADGAELVFTSSGGALDGLTANADLDLATNNYANAHVLNGLTLNSTAWLGNATGSTHGGLYFDNTETLGGAGMVVFGKSSSNFLDTYNTAYNDPDALTLTIGPSMTIKGSSGRLSDRYYYYGGTIINQGTILADDSGGLSSFAYDTGFSDSYYASTTNTAATIDTSGVTNPAPQIVYQTARGGYYYSSSFTYTLSDLTPDAIYTVRLHFAEIQQNVKVGERLFHVDLNGTRVLTDFDIRDKAGGVDKAVVEEFTATADASGQIVIDLIGVYTPAYYNGPSINGLELLSGGTVVQAINAGQQAGGTITINASSFVNQGTVEVKNDEVLNVGGLSGNAGHITLAASGSQLSLDGNYVVDQGLAASAGQTLTLSGTWTNASGSTITAIDATLNVGSDSGIWSNAGTMTATDSTVNLGGVFTGLGLGTFNRSGGTVNLKGTLNNRHIDQELLSGSSAAKVLVPTDDSLGDSWLNLAFDDSPWTSGPASVGFDRNSGRPYAGQILTDVEASMFNHNNSVYIRVPFNVVDPTALSGMVLNMNYDDGFVAYLNGVEIARSNAPYYYNSLTWNSSSSGTHDAKLLQTFDLGGQMSLLQPGANVLAIQGLNYSYDAQDSDLLIQPQLLVGLKSSDTPFALNGTTGSWNLLGGRIQGGTYTSANGGKLVFTSSGGTLDGVTGNADLDLATNYGAYAHVVSGLTLNATAWLGNATGSTYGGLYFDNLQTLGGTGTVLFGKSSGNFLNTYNTNYNDPDAVTLTIGPSMTIKGSSGNLSDGYYGGAIINQGTILADDSGGLSSFAYDKDFSGGYPLNTGTAIDVSDVTDVAPQLVYQTARYGSYTISYTLPDLTAGSDYRLRLHFAEIQNLSVGQRLFHVDVNGTQVLTDYDIRAAADGINKAIIEEFTATADTSGQIVVTLTYSGGGYYPAINGVELLSGATVLQAINAGQQAGGTITINAPFTNQGTVEAKNGEVLNINSFSGKVGQMTLAGSGSQLTLNGNYVVDQGLSVSVGQKLTLNGTWSNLVGSTITATDATLNLGNGSSSWSNAGAIGAIDSTVNLGGVFTGVGLGTFNRSGGTVNLTGTLNNTPPANPTGVSAVGLFGGGGVIQWVDASSDERGFAVERSSDGTTFTEIGTVAANATRYYDQGLTSGQTYYYRVRAYGDAGEAPGLVSAALTIPDSALSLDFSSGFTQTDGLTLNGVTVVDGRLRVTNKGYYEANSVFTTIPLPIIAFTTEFTFQLSDAAADGFAFVIQGNSPEEVGSAGGGLGYAGIANSAAIKFDIYSDSGEGGNSVGFFTDGEYPTTPADNLTGTGIDLHSGNVFAVTVTYGAFGLQLTIRDTVTDASFTKTYAVDLLTTVGSPLAFIGFTGATNYYGAVQDILNWRYTQSNESSLPTNTAGPVKPQAITTLALNSATGSWNLLGGRIRGGTYTSADGAGLIFTSSGGTLDSVTANADLDLATNNNANAHVLNGLTLNSTAWLGNATGSTYGGLYFDGLQTLDGTGTVLFGKSTSNYLNTYNTTYNDPTVGTLTIGPTVTITGSSGNLSAGYYGATIVNQGTILADDSGGLSSFAYDTNFSGGYSINTGTAIDVSGVTNPAPQLVYQTSRYGSYTISYTLPDLTAASDYTLRLHFAEIQNLSVGQRLFHVDVNGTRVLTDFDIRVTAGGVNKAVVEEFTATADSTGQIVVTLTYSGGGYYPAINGVELLSGATVLKAINAGQQAGGTITINNSSFSNNGTVRATNGGVLTISNFAANKNVIAVGPGSAINVNGDLPNSSSANISMEIGGTNSTEFGQINVSGQATLSGTLDIVFVDGFDPNIGDSFLTINFGSRTGEFTSVNVNNLPGGKVLNPVYDTDNVTLVTAAALRVAGGVKSADVVMGKLTASDVMVLLPDAIAKWIAAGWNVDGTQIESRIKIEIADLSNIGPYLALSAGDTIWVDDNAAGYGWFVDPTPKDNKEFMLNANRLMLSAIPNSAAVGRIDLITALAHELGHLLGFGHSDDANDLMAADLGTGVRHLLSPAEADVVLCADTNWIEELKLAELSDDSVRGLRR